MEACSAPGRLETRRRPETNVSDNPILPQPRDHIIIVTQANRANAFAGVFAQ